VLHFIRKAAQILPGGLHEYERLQTFPHSPMVRLC
jgi:hypothetical protein